MQKIKHQDWLGTVKNACPLAPLPLIYRKQIINSTGRTFPTVSSQFETALVTKLHKRRTDSPLADIPSCDIPGDKTLPSGRADKFAETRIDSSRQTAAFKTTVEINQSRLDVAVDDGRPRPLCCVFFFGPRISVYLEVKSIGRANCARGGGN